MANNYEDGVWRTVGGRRIFIRDGESLGSAMRRSGKFKSNKKKQEEHYASEELYSDDPNRFGNKLKEYNNRMSKEQEESAKRVDERYEEELKEKYMNIPEEERVKAYEEGKNWKDLVKEKDKSSSIKSQQNKIDEEVSNMYGKDLREAYNTLEDDDNSYEAKAIRKEYEKRTANEKKFHEATKSMMRESNQSSNDESFTMAKDGKTVTVSKNDEGKWEDSEGNKYMGYLSKEDVKSYFKGDWKEVRGTSNKSSQSNVRSQQSDIEKASGLKVKRAFETDAFGTGKEDRFELEDGRYIAHSTESMGSKEDSWSINKVEGGDIKSQEFKSYDDMIKHLNTTNKLNQKPIEYKPIKSNYNQGMDIEGQQVQGYHSDIATIHKELRTTGDRYPGGSKTTWEVPELEAINKKSSFATAKEAKAAVEENRAELTKYSQTNKNSQSHQYLTEIKSDSKFSQPGKKWELIDKSDRYYKTRYLVKDEDGNMEWKWADMFEKNKSSKTSSKASLESNAYKKAFEDYKKKHPNSKLTLNKFIDISEGK